MSDFIPPFPERSKDTLSALNILKHARKDLLSIWPESAFRTQFMGTKIINRSVFIANCPNVVRYVFVTNHANYERKSLLMRKALEPLLGNGLFISDGATWQKHRAIETPLFSTEQVAKYSEVMVKTTEEYVQKWSRLQSGDTLNVLTEMGQLTADIICRTLFGSELGAAQAATVVSSFAQYQAAIEQMDINTFFGLPSWVPGLTSSKANKTKATNAAQAIHQIVDKVIAEGVKSDNKDTLLAQLLLRRDDSDPERALTTEAIRNELIVLFMAGHETTANTLAWAWYLISQCPEVEQRLHEEVDSVLGSGSACFDDFNKLPFTQAIIDETLRLYPPVPILSREAMAEDTIRNRTIPAGSIILVVPWLLHRHEKYWDKPNHFIPERFLANAEIKPDKFAYVPFSVGPRVCLAKFFGTVEATLCLAVLARHFRLTLPLGTAVKHECRLTLRPEKNLPMQLVKR
jgi:cytochrome P450